jgi:hypothetical protein
MDLIQCDQMIKNAQFEGKLAETFADLKMSKHPRQSSI